MASEREQQQQTEALISDVREVLAAARKDSAFLDGRDFDPGPHDLADRSLDALAARLSGLQEQLEWAGAVNKALLERHTALTQENARLSGLQDTLAEGLAIYDEFDTAKPGGVLRGNDTRGAVQMTLDRWCYRAFGPDGTVRAALALGGEARDGE